MLANTFITLLSTVSLASLASAVPLKATSTEHTIAKRQAGNPLDVTVIAYAQVSALGLQVSARCLQVQVAADAGLTAVQNAVSAAANVGLGVGQVANTQICASANNRVPVCVDATGCGLGACLPGFADDGSGNCLPIIISNNALDATVLASVDVNLGGVVGLTTQCLLVPVAADAGLTEIQNAVSAQAQADLGVTNIADVNLCLAVNNRIPTCDSVNGCSTGGCLPGFALDTTTNTCIAVIIPAPTPSARLRRRNIQRRTLCPSTKETACSLSGSSNLSNSAVVSHQYECHDLSSSIEACGACGNVCTGAGEGCQDGECIKMD